MAGVCPGHRQVGAEHRFKGGGIGDQEEPPTGGEAGIVGKGKGDAGDEGGASEAEGLVSDVEEFDIFGELRSSRRVVENLRDDKVSGGCERVGDEGGLVEGAPFSGIVAPCRDRGGGVDRHRGVVRVGADDIDL